jgi:putative transposase
VNSQSLQQSLFNLDEAYKRFFKHKSNFPKFKKKSSRQSCRFPQNNEICFDNKKIRLRGIGYIDISIDRVFDGKIKSATVSKDPSGKFFASILVDNGKELPKTEPYSEETTIGLDLGLSYFVTLSNGDKVSNPRFLKHSLDRLKREQRRLSRKQKGSKNRNKQRIRVALAHEKIRNQRNDFHHKLSTRLIRENQAVAIEDLNVSGMVRNRRLSRAISDVGWSEFVRQLKYKAEWYGKTVLQIGRFEPSSKFCTCGVVNKSLKLSDRIWACTSCGVIHDRDILAANNIKCFALGQGMSELTPLETCCN